MTSDHSVQAYFQTNGKYVQAYRATDPNGTTRDNYSTIGNTNPYTGIAGSKPNVRP